METRNVKVVNPQTEGEIQRYRAGVEFGYNQGIKASLSEIKKLREVISEYAKEENWKEGVMSGDNMVSWAEIDRGKKARSFLWSPDFGEDKVG